MKCCRLNTPPVGKIYQKSNADSVNYVLPNTELALFCPEPSWLALRNSEVPHFALEPLLIHTLFTVFCNTKNYRFFPCCWLLIPDMYHGGRFHHTPRLQRVFSTIEQLSFLKRKSRLSRRPFIASKGVIHLESIVHRKH